MWIKIFFAASFTLLLAASGYAGEVHVVATIPDLADIATEIGGDRVEVKSICKGRENIHAVHVKPSHVVAMSKADLFLEMGLSMEHAWVPGLLMTARNRKIQTGAPGFVNASEGWEAINVPDSLSRKQAADIHPEGNPHFNVDPAGGRHMAARVLEGLVRVDPEGQAYYEQRYASYAARLDTCEKRWRALGDALSGKKVVTYHTEFDYMLRKYGVELVATIEPKPGVPPSPPHILEVIQTMRGQDVKVILTAAWSAGKQVDEVAKKTDARVFEMPTMVHGAQGADSWIAMMDVIHERLAAAFGLEYKTP